MIKKYFASHACKIFFLTCSHSLSYSSEILSMILLPSFFRDLQLLFRGKEPSRTSILYYPSHFCLPCPVLPRGVAMFQEEETKGSRANPRILGETAQAACSCSRHCTHRPNSNSAAFGCPWTPFLFRFVLFVWRIRNACLGSDKKLKKAADMCEERNWFSTMRCQKHW